MTERDRFLKRIELLRDQIRSILRCRVITKHKNNPNN